MGQIPENDEKSRTGNQTCPFDKCRYTQASVPGDHKTPESFNKQFTHSKEIYSRLFDLLK